MKMRNYKIVLMNGERRYGASKATYSEIMSRFDYVDFIEIGQFKIPKTSVLYIEEVC